MTNRDRLHALHNRKPVDRLPMLEWAIWWDLTLNRWYDEGLPRDIEFWRIGPSLGMDYHRQFWIVPRADNCPGPEHHGGAIIKNEAEYEALLPCLFPKDAVTRYSDEFARLKPAHDSGELIIWLTLEGWFWFPRVLFGIEAHLYSFYDYPQLYHRMAEDLLEYNLRLIDEFCAYQMPDFISVTEDLSYNHGPMISKALFDEFMLPYYKRFTAECKKRGIKVFMDSDGDIMPIIPWLIDAGVNGIYPLERMAGVDVARIRQQYPQFLMMGGFDKTVMHKGEAAMRSEFERLLPVMKSGGYLPAVDHQTPPDVSLETYRVYVKLLAEYVRRAAE